MQFTREGNYDCCMEVSASYTDVILWALIGGVVSLGGGMLLLSHKKTVAILTKLAIPFAAGALLGAAFFDLIPESFELTTEGAASRWILAGLLIFFFLELLLHWFHHHQSDDHKHVKSAAPLIIVGDTAHNFIDGLAIGTAFLINIPLGIVTAIAVAAHEIPQEIGDFGLLLKAGFSKRKVLIINGLSSLATLAGALLTFWLGSRIDLPLGEILAITAGMFIYIAASDLIPAIHQESKGKSSTLAAGLLLLGILVVSITTDIAHEKIRETEAQHQDGCVTYFDQSGKNILWKDCPEADSHTHE